MKYCTRGIQRSPEQKASINAQSVHTFTLQLRTTIHASGKFMCTGGAGYVRLLNVSGSHRIVMSKITVNTTTLIFFFLF